MPYEIGFAPKGRTTLSKAYQPSAVSALKTIKTLQARDEQISYINGPDGREIRVSELSVLAEREISDLGREAKK